jgi:nucleoid DNA-binding protein
MNKEEMIKAIVERTGLTTKAVASVIDTEQELIIEQVSAGNTVRLVNFATFTPKKRGAIKGRNPKDGTPYDVPAVMVAKVSVGKRFADAVALLPLR